MIAVYLGGAGACLGCIHQRRARRRLVLEPRFHLGDGGARDGQIKGILWLGNGLGIFRSLRRARPVSMRPVIKVFLADVPTVSIVAPPW